MGFTGSTRTRSSSRSSQRNTTPSLRPRRSSVRSLVCSGQVSPRVSHPSTIHAAHGLTWPGYTAGKFPTPVSHAEDLNDKLTEVRSTIKFQLKKVLCLGVAVGHVQMTEDQVLGNVMLSACPFRLSPVIMELIMFGGNRHQLPRVPLEEELAECQVVACQDDDGQARSSLLVPPLSSTSRTSSAHDAKIPMTGFSGPDERDGAAVQCTNEPRTLLPTPLFLD
jgi:hypothetical protein